MPRARTARRRLARRAGYWAVFRHADVKHVLRTPEVFSSHLGATQLRDPDSPEDLDFVRAMMLNQDPPAHVRLRRIVAAAFTPRAVRELEDVIEARARALVGAVAPRGAADFVPLAADLPVRTLAHLMGVPRRTAGCWRTGRTGSSATRTPARHRRRRRPRRAQPPRPRRARPAPRTARPARRSPAQPPLRAALPDMFAYAHGLRRAAGAGQRDGPDAPGGLTGDEFETMFFLFAVAGNETLRKRRPRRAAHPPRPPGPAGAAPRAPRTHRPGGRGGAAPLAAGAPLPAHRHPGHRARRRARPARREGRRPPRLRQPRRTRLPGPRPLRHHPRSPNDHVSFGFGPHFCLGAHLARVQLRALLWAALDLLPGLERAGEPVRLTSNFQNGLTRLPVRWRTDP
ncbi:hypothetical protein GCM10020221_23140 [Streptomyces thioluteus]|uniref:Cytochrome P450 n=1 Tax=Streptomyces thioluteus TaxID=66431 RepID=A0ABN3WSI9_STRTU